ncbi:MAG: hypothetical protein RBU30_09870, partial [Polyangia bacterium]|nr:hypothetical protein [Polyangia bacterium]
SSRLEAALQDERRQVLLADFRFAVGDLFPRGPSLTALIRNSTALSPSDRALLIGSICARGPRDVEPFSHLLRHHGFLVAHVEEDLREPYFELVDSLLGHILEAVLSDGRDERTSVLRVYLTILRESYLPRLARYSGVLREARAGAELFADLLLEPYLARMGVLDGSREPSLLGLIEDWTALQQVLERQQGYKGAPFSLADGLLEWERRWMEFRGQASVSSPLEDGGPLTQTSEVGRAEGRARRRTLSDYGTFLRLPVQPPPSEPELEAAIGQGAAAADPFGEEAVTDPFGVPKMGPELFDAVTRRLPVLDAALLDSSGGLTLLEPSALGRAGALHRAATIILPVSASGEPDEGLHQASTLIFPVQSVPVSRNEAICRRVDVLLASDRDRSQRPSERLRSELLLMQDGDRIIAEQYLAQSVEREMAGISRRLEAARGMSNVTLDDFAGAMLSTVLRDYVVTGYLRRVFVAECVGLYGRFLRREPPEQTVTDSLQLALFTVLNAHQERLRLPLEVEAELVLLAALPQGQPLPTRLPYHHPGPLVLPPDLSARVARTGSWQLVFDAEHLLVSHMQELERFVQGVSSLGIFADLEAALGASGFGPAPYLAFCAELRSRIYKIVERFRRLFLRLDEAGAESAAIEGSFLELIAYGRAVWSGSLLPALGFYAKMAFGLREGDQGFGSALDRQAGQSLK